MSRYTMSVAKATALLKDCAAARVKWGKKTSPPYTVAQIMEALELVSENGFFEERVDPAELTKLRRQLSAANARVARLSKGAQTGASSIADSDDTVSVGEE